MVEPIEQANLRLIHALGVDDDGRPCVADVACKERARVMRLAGTVNYKTGQHARVVEADFALPAYSVAELGGALPDPSPIRRSETAVRRASAGEDPYKQIAPPEYFRRLAGITVPRGGPVSCHRHPLIATGTRRAVSARRQRGLVLPCRGLRGARRDL